MKFVKAVLMIALVAMASLSLVQCAPKSPSVAKVEKSLDDLKAGIEANGTDCAKIAAAIKTPASDLTAALKEVKEKNEKLPATTQVKFAGLVSSFQKIGACSKTPEMQAVFESLVASATAQ
ncbi:MAG TPA: hypothetical protein PKA91_13155 [Leptospiraceae bacterium]|jgi:Skp family chaperone for outer membrane proteins|nr:hypothetical protein [Leptospiraceae bacterium]HNE22947.1 hypothetical protein [Leptospiraceae bacterium]HNL02182.1 hypothetical protein [Leptospiraceae bacterium]